MKVARKLLLTGGATLVMAGGILALPLAKPAGALSLESLTKPLDSFVLKEEETASFGIMTEVDPGDHVLWATVTNKTDKAIVPQITFNGELPLYVSDVPLKPGESRKYPYYFTGNNFMVEVKVSAEGVETATSSPYVDIQEPVSFQATETNDTVVIGTLRNNSTLVPQTAYTKINDTTKIEYLKPGESRTIAIPHSTVEGQKLAGLRIATGSGYESGYVVELGLKPELSVPF